MKVLTSIVFVVLACLFVSFQVAQCNPLAEANAEADPFFFGGLLGRGGFGRGGYGGGYGGYGGREGGGFGRRHGFGFGFGR